MLRKTIFLLLLSFSSLFSMHRFMLNISDLDLEVNGALDLGQFNSSVGVDSYFIGGGLISTNDGQGDLLYSVDAVFINDLPDVEGMRFGMGMKFVYTNNGAESFLAAPVGVILDYLIQNKNNLPIFAVANLFYAPGSLSFSDARNYFEVRAEIHYEMIENMRAFFGLRSINTNFNTSGDTIFNETIYGGMRLGF